MAWNIFVYIESVLYFLILCTTHNYIGHIMDVSLLIFLLFIADAFNNCILYYTYFYMLAILYNFLQAGSLSAILGIIINAINNSWLY